MLTYRPDIDGLRAVAVLSVLFFHLDETLLKGGFVGVDIFFVISGYLITKLIYKELQSSGDFSFKTFYLRRVRRLAPALIATIALSTIVASTMLSPSHLIEYGKSAVASILSVSNIYFWQAVNYFDTESQLKPLLHTWSLSVEEQFYFLWPATLFLLFAIKRNWVIPVFITVIGIASLALNLWLFAEQAEISTWFGSEDNQSNFSAHSTAFYWLPFRVFEFAIGAILVFLPSIDKFKSVPLIKEMCFVIGLIFIAYSVTQLNAEIEFPSTAALWPCIGAALIIFCGPSHRFAFLLSNPLAVGIGLISYSLYLMHWPVIVFYKYWTGDEFTYIEQLAIILVSFLLAYGSYKFVEQPFRKARQSKNKTFLISSAVSALLLISISAHAITSGGWLHRYPKEVVAQLSYKKGDYTKVFWSNFFRLETAFNNTGKPKVLIIGDSMAADFINILVEGGLENQFDLATIPIGDNCKVALPLTETQYQWLYGGAKDICKKQHQKVFDNISQVKEADTIVLASYWLEQHWSKYVETTAAFLSKESDAQILVLGLKDQVSSGIWFLNKHSIKPGIDKLRTPLAPQAAAANSWIKHHKKSFEYFDLLPQFCNPHGCQRVTKEGYVIIFDQSHFSQQGARFIGEQVSETGWFKKLLKKRS